MPRYPNANNCRKGGIRLVFSEWHILTEQEGGLESQATARMCVSLVSGESFNRAHSYEQKFMTIDLR